jgi:hypothetical protein
MELPGTEDRTVIIGRTGSGKTYAGLWMLAQMPIDEMPWIAIDYKRDKSIALIPYARYIDVGKLPEEPGVYIVQPMHNEDIEDYLMSIWEREHIGLYIDEGVMLSGSNALDTILVQGRSKHIPVIVLSQRPVGISRWVFSESQYMMIFPNHDRRERKTIAEFAPLFQGRNAEDDLLPMYHSYYFDVKAQKTEILKPVPPIAVTLKIFADKLKPEDEINAPAPVRAPGVRYVEI